MDNPQLASSVLTYDMAATAQARIDEEVAEYIQSIRCLHTERNTLSPISRLPNETLASIFIHCARDYFDNHDGRPISTAPTWVHVSYVCRHWRNVALGCPTLWTYLFIASPRWTDELLARSKQAPLKVHMKPYRRDNLAFVAQLKNHVERVQEFRLALPGVRSVHQFFSELSSPTPHLQHFEVSIELNDDSDDLVPPYPSVLFDGDTPTLRTLALSHCPLPWYSLKLSSLTTLNLFVVPVRFRQTTKEFLTTLSCMQDLVYLYLEDALASATDFLSGTAFSTLQKIDLPHLSRCLIAAPLSTVIALLSCVNIPLTTEVRLECVSEDDTSLDDYATLTSLIAQLFSMSHDRAPSGLNIRSLVIDSYGSLAKLTFSVSERHCESFRYITHKEWDRNIPLAICFFFGQSTEEDDQDRIISDICRSIPLNHVQSTHILEPQFRWSSTFWERILGHLPGLQYLKLSRGSMPNLAPVLSVTSPGCTENKRSHADCGLNPVFVPSLKELELHESTATNLQALCDALSTRRESPGLLTMTRCAEYIDGCKKKFNMVGQWEGGRFYVVERRNLRQHYSIFMSSDEDE